MRVYFTSCEPCALRLGGAFAGFCSEHEKFADLSAKDKIVAEFFPENADADPLSFIADEKFFSAPPDFADIYDFGCGKLIHIKRFFLRGGEMKALSQLREGNVLATLYKDTAMRLALEADKDFEIKTLPYEIRSARLFSFRAGNKSLIALEEESDSQEKFLALFDGTHPLFEGRVLSFSGGERLQLQQAFHDTAGHTADSLWDVGEKELKLVRYETKTRQDFSPAALDDKILPFAFFQTVLARGDYRSYLSEGLLPRAEKLVQYLGNFTSVALPPSVFYLEKGEINAAGLVYQEKQNLYRVRFFQTPSENGKIVNIVPVEM